jgi:hypothetical protein
VIHVEPPRTASAIGAPSAPEIKGWLKVLGWPGLSWLQEHRHVEVVGDAVSVEPAGLYLAQLRRTRSQESIISIVETATGSEHEINPGGSFFTWSDAGQIVIAPVATSGRGTGAVHSAEGGRVRELPNVGRFLDASNDGARIAFLQEAFDGESSFVTLLEDDALVEIEQLGAAGYVFNCSPPDLSGDGTAVAVGCTFNTPTEELDGGDNAIALLHLL